jgi:hypothetical protein
MIKFTVRGQPCSKANSRAIVMWGKRPALIKSADALQYERDFDLQMPARARVMSMMRAMNSRTGKASAS